MGDSWKNTSSFLCPNVHSTFFSLQTGVLLILSGTSIVITILLINLLSIHGLFHANVRLTLQNFCFTNLLTSMVLLFRGTHNFVILTFGRDPWCFPPLFCSAQDHFRNTVNTVALLSMSIIGFERLIATVRQKYLDPEEPSKLMKITLAFVWVCALAYGLSGLKPNKDNGQTCYCFTASNSDDKSLIYIFIPYLFLMLATVSSFLFVLFMNKRLSGTIMNISKHSLQARYLISNNMSTTRCLLPTVVVNSVLYMVIVLSQFIMKLLSFNDDMITAINSWSVTYLLISFGCFIEPLLLVKFNGKLQTAALKKFRKFKRHFYILSKPSTSKIEPITISTVISFKLHPDKSQQIIDDIWSRNPPKKPSKS